MDQIIFLTSKNQKASNYRKEASHTSDKLEGMETASIGQ